MPEMPAGVRFSLNYISHPELLPDSARMRRRLGLLFFNTCDGSKLRQKMNSELGTDLKSNACATEPYWRQAMIAVELRDVLDTVTIVYGTLCDGGIVIKEQVDHYVSEVRRIFYEERVRYKLDDKGGVHLAVDAAFEQTRISSVQALSAPRYAGVRKALEEAYNALDGIPPDGKAAMRHAFFANESLFRLIFPNAHQLGKGELDKYLKPAVDAKYQGLLPAVYAAQKQFTQYTNWVAGAHFYRHEPGAEEPIQPPLEMAIHYVTAGTAWLRWLQGFDAAKGQ